LALAEDQDRAARIEKWLRMLVVASSVFVMLLFVVTALERLRFPYELEQLEGSMFLSVLRVFHGQALYPRPSLAFIPYMYPPVYYYVSAAAGHVMGMTITTLRSVSILSTLGCFAMIYALVRKEVQRHLPAIAAAGLYAGCYSLCAGWFDLGRLDSFFILTLLLAMYATRWWHPAVAGALWTLAFQTKQSILPAAFVMLCFDFGMQRGRLQRTVSGVTALALGAAGSVLWLNHATGGWFNFYIFTVPGANADLQLRTAALFWPIDILRPLALALIVLFAAASVHAACLAQPRRALLPGGVFHGAALLVDPHALRVDGERADAHLCAAGGALRHCAGAAAERDAQPAAAGGTSGRVAGAAGGTRAGGRRHLQPRRLSPESADGHLDGRGRRACSRYPRGRLRAAASVLRAPRWQADRGRHHIIA
jgi:hypothetical protein